MVNRTLEAKRFKMKKMRQKRPRFLQMSDGYIKTKASVGAGGVPEAALALFKYNERARGTEHEDVTDILCRALFPELCPTEMRPLMQPEHYRLRRNTKIQSRSLIVHKAKFSTTIIVVDSDMKVSYFIEYNGYAKFIRKSCKYSSYKAAMEAYRYQKVYWLKPVDLSITDTGNSSPSQ
jgi:hypothetical protein